MAAVALVDCNNFFVSCERVFRPNLNGRPVIVLSNNDGCVISRSEEAKALGIGMGVPFFEVRPIVAEHRVAFLSANHELYVDFSRRIVEILQRHSPCVQNYSIDESFLSLPEDASLAERAAAIRDEITRWTGVPVSVGLGTTKAVAKLAADRAKKAEGVLSLVDTATRERALTDTPVDHVWGIAKRSALRLATHGVRTAAQFAELQDRLILKALGIGGLRLAHELRGVPCLSLASCAPEPRSVMVSRSFGRPVGSLAPLETAAASFVARAAERARRHGLKTGSLRLFVMWREEGRIIGDDASTRMTPTDDTALLIGAAKSLAERLFVEGRAYRKIGVVLTALEAENAGQADLFEDERTRRRRHLMRTVDRLNASFGEGAVLYGGEALSSAWAPLCANRSPRWTTHWEELPQLRGA